MSETVAVHVLIEGRVQAVGFRFFTKEQAQKLGLTGWVRNTFDGNVEAYAEGMKEDLEIWLTHLHRGPRSAFVTNIKKEWSTPQGKFRYFQILPTQ